MELNVFWAWLAVAVVCAIVEISLPSFGVIFASSSSVLAGAAGALGAPLAAQIGIFAVSLPLQLALLRPRLLKSFGSGRNPIPSRAEALIGRSGRVTAVESERRGRADFDGQDWAVQADFALAQGEEVTAYGFDNLVILVRKRD